MIIGLKFEIPNNYGQYLKEIFEDIAIEQYYWQINYNDSFKLIRDRPVDLFPDGYFLTGIELKKIINEPKYYVVFLAMVASKNKLDNVVYMKNYSDFLKTEFEILINIYDNSFVIIYCKNDDILKQFEKNILKNSYQNISFITVDNVIEHFDDFA